MISRRVAALPRVASRETADRAAARRAAGGEVLPLYGAPFWLPPEYVLEAAERAAHEVVPAPPTGFPELRQAISARIEREQGLSLDPEREIIVTYAAMHALSIVFQTILDPGDEVVMASPTFFFDGVIRLNGGVPVLVPGQFENDWNWDLEALAAAITPRTKAILVNNPTNPTGYVATKEDLEAVVALAERHGLLIVSDEAYDNMVYDGRRHLSISALPGAHERTIGIFSFTKSFAMKQWRVGYLTAPMSLTPHLQKVLEWNILNANHVAQRAAQAALEGPQDWVRTIAVRYQHCRDLMIDGLKDASGLSFVVPVGGPFIFLRAAGLSGNELSTRLLNDCGIATDPGAPFGNPDYVRLSFGGEDEIVQEAARRIAEFAASR
jgi:aspartate/methionine/tyrosine aminotransferase